MQNNHLQPVIQKALGGEWDKLDKVVKRHYDMTPGEKSAITIHGVMSEVYHSKTAKLFLLPGRLFGALVPYRGKQIPTQVENWTTASDSRAMFWHRTLHFPNREPVHFRSRMEHIRDKEIIEYVKYGMGIRMRMSTVGGALHFDSLGYVWSIGPVKLPIPSWAILGHARIIERAISETEFFIDFNIVHPLFGMTFSYSGTFSIIEGE